MILDERNEFADAVAVIATAATGILGDVIDIKSPTIAPNTTVDLEGSEMYFVLRVATTIAVLTSLRVQLVSDSVATLDSSPTVHADTGVIALANIPAGGKNWFVGKLPSGNYERYLGVIMTAVGAGGTGALDAFLTSDPALYRAYADNVA